MQQVVKKIKPDVLGIKYHPMVNDLVVTIGVQLHYDYEKHQFDVNQDEYGDPDLSPIHRVAVNDDFSQLSFEAEFDGLPTQFVVSANNPIEKALVETFAAINSNGKLKPGKDLDHMQFFFDKGKLESIEIYKHDEEFNILETLDIVLDKPTGNYVLIIQVPYQKIKLNTIEVTDTELIGRSADQAFVFKWNTQKVIVEALKKLIAVSV